MSLKGLPITDTLSESRDVQGLQRDEIFDVLSNQRRRYVLHYLKQHEGRRVELRELVDQVAAWEHETTIDALESDKRKNVYSSLRQFHLPMMAEADVIEYEHMRGEVELTEQAREVQMYLEYVPANDIPWSWYYLGLSAVGALLVGATWAGVFPFAGLSGVQLAAILAVLYSASACVHAFQSMQNRLGSDRFEIEDT